MALINFNKHPTLIICLSDGRGGMEIDTLKLHRSLSQVTECYLLYRDETFIAELVRDDEVIADKSIGVKLNRLMIKKFFSIKLAREVRKFIKGKNIKNVIFFGKAEMKSLFFSFLGLDLNIIMRHGTTHSRKRKGLHRKLLYSQIDKHVTISRHLANNIAHIFPVKSLDSIVTIYPSLYFRADAVRIGSLKNDKIRILHSGRVAPGKGHLDAIEACGRLYENGLDFEFTCLGDLGDAQYMKKVNELIEQKPYAGKIKLLGHIGNIQDYLSHSDVFLFPSAGEGFCNSFNEALAAGLVCIAYNNTAFPEFRDNGFYFHLVDDSDVKSLGDTLLKVACNINEEISKSRKNTSLAKKYYSEEVELKSYLSLLV